MPWRSTLFLLLCASFAIGQNQRIKVMTYNLMYFRANSAPCSHTQSPSQRMNELKTIFQFAKPHVLLVNELGNTPTNSDVILINAINVDGQLNYAKADFSGNGSSIVNMLFFDTTLVDLKSQARIENDINNNRLVRNIDVYRLYFKNPDLKAGLDTTYFYVVGCHLKAGDGTSDQLERKAAADAVMQYLSSNLANENVILAGDLNIYRSSEPAYQAFIAASDTAIRLHDPLARPGNWNNSSSFADIHTQSTHSSGSGCHSGGGSDDRFDFILTSNAILKQQNRMRFFPGSYLTIGQDGQHFNQSINNGSNSSAPANIITALYNLSDHLPVMASFDYLPSGLSRTTYSLQLEKLQFNNPVQSHLHLQAMRLDKPLQLEIYDLSGRSLHRMEWNGQEVEIPLTYLSKGLYFLSVKGTQGQSYTYKFLKA